MLLTLAFGYVRYGGGPAMLRLDAIGAAVIFLTMMALLTFAILLDASGQPRVSVGGAVAFRRNSSPRSRARPTPTRSGWRSMACAYQGDRGRKAHCRIPKFTGVPLRPFATEQASIATMRCLDV